ncbi:MAG: ComEC/Rec2 family competence protein [Candidatus Omnitrophota bacterium]
MNKRPLFIIALCLVIGIIIAGFLPKKVDFICILIPVCVFIILSLLSFKSKASCNIFISLSIIGLAVLLYINSNTFPNDHISGLLREGSQPSVLVGAIKQPILMRKAYFGKVISRYLFEVEGVKVKDHWVGMKGLTYLDVQKETLYDYGDRLLVEGVIKRPVKKTDFNYREYLERKNIFLLVSSKENSIRLLSKDHRSSYVLKLVYYIRARLSSKIIEYMPIENGAFFRAILLGDRSELSRGVKDSFKASGIMHILAISGLHVGLVALVVMMLLKAIGIKREWTYFITMIFLAFFVILTLSPVSVVRATIMIYVFLMGMILGRKVDMCNSLGLAAIFVLARNPKELFNAGFQLSFLIVLSIACLAPYFMKLAGHRGHPYIRKYIYAPFSVSLAAWVGSFPLLLYYFRVICPISIVSNLFIIPIVFVLLLSGILFIILSWAPFAGEYLIYASNFIIDKIFYLANFFSSLRFGHFYI